MTATCAALHYCRCLPTTHQLTERKERAERALEAKSLPLDVVLECLALREQRVSIDLVRDEVEAELQKVNLPLNCMKAEDNN